MNQATPAVRDLARRLLSLEARGSKQAPGEAHAALSALEHLRSSLSKLIGVAGFEALLSRALVLAKPEASWLQAVRVASDATLDGFHEAAQHQSAETVVEGSVALLAQLLELLVTFIGTALTLRLVKDMWPQARVDHLNFSAGETP
jgi:hypothetical protein